LRRARRGDRSPPQFAWRSAVELLKGLVESPHAAEAAGERDFDHRQIRLVDQLLRQQHAASLRDAHGRCPNVPAKEPPKLALADFQPIGERRDIPIIKRPRLNHLQCPRHGRRGAPPRVEIRRAFRPTPQTRPKPRRLRRRGSGQKRTVFQLGRTGRANGPAIDAGGLHASEKPPVVPGIPSQHRPVTN
ncbi:MAG: hypothetical protein JWP03_4390, partial [Phycisphaerales bacterium]|nr:hypothetical protein [Phycisphaerales bacterium]